jgi:hypothetical protein
MHAYLHSGPLIRVARSTPTDAGADRRYDTATPLALTMLAQSDACMPRRAVRAGADGELPDSQRTRADNRLMPRYTLRVFWSDADQAWAGC